LRINFFSETAPASGDIARQNLALSFGSAFMNAGFSKDALLTPDGTGGLFFFFSFLFFSFLFFS